MVILITKKLEIPLPIYWSRRFSRKLYYQYNDHERIRSNLVTNIMITNVLSNIHYQYNDHEAFFGRLITGNVHDGHDHIHDLQRLRHPRQKHTNGGSSKVLVNKATRVRGNKKKTFVPNLCFKSPKNNQKNTKIDWRSIN